MLSAKVVPEAPRKEAVVIELAAKYQPRLEEATTFLPRCSIVSLIWNLSAEWALLPPMDSGGIVLTVVGLLGRVVMPSSANSRPP
jgi:hypothetical protein